MDNNNARLRYELRQAVTNWVSNVMGQNQIPASMMEDALTDVLLKVRDLAFRECIEQMAADHEKEMQELTESLAPKEEPQVTEEEA